MAMRRSGLEKKLTGQEEIFDHEIQFSYGPQKLKLLEIKDYYQSLETVLVNTIKPARTRKKSPSIIFAAKQMLLENELKTILNTSFGENRSIVDLKLGRPMTGAISIFINRIACVYLDNHEENIPFFFKALRMIQKHLIKCGVHPVNTLLFQTYQDNYAWVKKHRNLNHLNFASEVTRLIAIGAIYNIYTGNPPAIEFSRLFPALIELQHRMEKYFLDAYPKLDNKELAIDFMCSFPQNQLLSQTYTWAKKHGWDEPLIIQFYDGVVHCMQNKDFILTPAGNIEIIRTDKIYALAQQTGLTSHEALALEYCTLLLNFTQNTFDHNSK